MASNTAPAVDEIPVVQVLEKERYFTQALVPLPSAVPYPPLAPSSVRLRAKVLAITSNSFTYAKFGFFAGYWDVHPLPSSAPAPYGDATIYGCTSTWGWAEVLASTHAGVPPGALLWGYQPLGTLAQDLTVQTDSQVPGHVIVTSPHRQRMAPLYNTYVQAADTAVLRGEIASRAIGPAYDALARVMFETAYLLNHYTLARDTAVPPSARPTAKPWTPNSADITGATILAAAPASKVGLCFAHQIRYDRGDKEFGGQQPARIIGLASKQSRVFAEQSGLYDAVVLADDSPLQSLAKLGVAPEEKVVVMVCFPADLCCSTVLITLLQEFGSRGDTGLKWATALEPVYEKLLMLTVGFEVTESTLR